MWVNICANIRQSNRERGRELGREVGRQGKEREIMVIAIIISSVAK